MVLFAESNIDLELPPEAREKGFYKWFRAPNESIVQNHLNIAFLNVYLNGRYRHIFIL